MRTYKLQNPILKGFNPDPSICKVGNDYYIATSTFEWFPGVQIHHSTDLINWELIGHGATRLSQLDMRGHGDSCGVWAPNLTYNDGLFYLVYTNVRNFEGRWKDLRNYVITSPDIVSGWSEPIYLTSSGFDPSLFHDENGRCWLLNLLVDHRNGKFFGGIVVQEYSYTQQQVIGEVYPIFAGTQLGITEGPNLYKRNEYYYLVTAEGGTEYAHAVTVARSRSLFGPYEVHPENPILTSYHNREAPLQKAGHASFMDNGDGNHYLACLVSRPLTERGRCPLGRETALQRIEWRTDEWPYLLAPSKEPLLEVEIPILDGFKVKEKEREVTIDFTSDKLPLSLMSLRVPVEPSWAAIGTKRAGWLSLKGRDSLCSLHEQSMIAHRVDSFEGEFTVCIEFEPTNFQQMAGLVAYYNTKHFHYLYLSYCEKEQCKVINVMTNNDGEFSDWLPEPIPVNGKSCYLKAVVNHANLHFSYSENQEDWIEINWTCDFSILSDDYVQHKVRYNPAFTGAFVGMCCQDLSNLDCWAHFKNFRYLR